MIDDDAVLSAMWAGDVEKLDELAPCVCCCWEHTFAPHCPAFVWNGCRGQDTPAEEAAHEGYAQWYWSTRGMTREEFFNEPVTT